MVSLKIQKKRFFWVVFFRLILIVIISATTFFLTESLISKDISFKIYSIITGGTFITILLMILYLSFGPLKWILYGNIISDLVLISVGLLWTNGINSPFIFLYNFSILSACFLEGRIGGTLAAAISTIFFGIIYFFNIPEDETFPNLILDFSINMGSFNAIAFFGILLAQHLKLTEKNLDVTLEQLKRLEIIQERLTDSLVSGLISIDSTGKIMTSNLSAEKILGINLSNSFGAPLKELWPTGIKMIHEFDKMQNIDEKRYEINFEHPFKGKRIIGISIFAIKDITEKDLGYGLIFQDITEIKANEQKMQHTDRLAALGEMAAGLAHEIRNPLASLSGAAQFIKEKQNIPKEETRLLDIIIRESKRLNELIKQFLMYAKPELSSVQSLNVNEEINYVLTMLQKRKSALNPNILLDVEENLTLYADPNQFKQVFYNLLLNAYQSIKKENGEIKIIAKKEYSKELSDKQELSGKSKKNCIVFIIEDNGEGISEDIKNKLFNPFFTTKPDGTGLGLSVVFRIIQSMEGEITFTSDVNTGTIFTVKIPENQNENNPQNNKV